MAGAAWWVAVPASEFVRKLTLGGLDPVLVAIFDIPLFVIASAIAAAGFRWAAWIVSVWTFIVGVAMACYATVTAQAGWGALIMLAVAAGSILALILVTTGELPTRRIIVGPFAFRSARARSRGALLTQSLTQMLLFWFVFLVLLPGVIAVVEWRWALTVELPIVVRIVGAGVLAAFSALGVWSALAMTVRGRGTPLPSAMPRELVVTGPYRIVRNPMAVAGIVQGVAVGMVLGSWLVVLYALIGSLVWNWAIRPHEERDLAERFGRSYEEYRRRVSCWIPRRPRGA